MLLFRKGEMMQELKELIEKEMNLLFPVTIIEEIGELAWEVKLYELQKAICSHISQNYISREEVKEKVKTLTISDVVSFTDTDIIPSGDSMNEKYVTNLEISKKLKELGVKQESEFYWSQKLKGNYKLAVVCKSVRLVRKRMINRENFAFYSAFLVGELGEILPYYVEEKNHSGEFGELVINKSNDGYWLVGYQFVNKIMSEENEVNARGKMLCYLLENNLIKKV